MRALGVVVPARDEQDHVVACLHGIRTALDRVPGRVTIAVTVVLDRCSDRTPRLAADELADWPGAVALRVAAVGGRRGGSATGPGPAHMVAGTGVGALRDLGVRSTLRRLRRFAPRDVWLLSTDADTTVPPDWAMAHLRLAAAGARGVAGLAELGPHPELSPAALRLYQQIVAAGMHGTRHHHVYGANLGVRADAYLAVGGFPHDGPGEGRALWNRLERTGMPLATPVEPVVRTSARLHGRAEGGLADLLRSLQAGSEPTRPAGLSAVPDPERPGAATDTPDGA
ncbi:glycosyltransferase [Pseudonocardia lacus]|uniref:glycosyltransferase n=1 Tax=Pseudonocardia lacus TaxID=2835865 RepID=UPI001BDD6211|nr:glycosyltransferase family 2 protein [Pseudonocardia lacus]